MAKFKAVVTDHEFEDLSIENRILKTIDAEVIDLHSKDPKVIIKNCKDADAMMVLYAPINSDVLAELDNCKIIVRYGVGYDNVDIDAATKCGIFVANVRNYGNHEVSTQAFSLLLACARRIVQLNNNVKSGRWTFADQKPIFRLWENQTAGLLGYGKIAQHMAKKCQAFGLKLIAYDPYVTADVMEKDGVRKVELDELLEQSDYVSVHAPLNESTFHILSDDQFELMKDTAYVINTARGSLIDEQALCQAVKAGKIAGAGLDVVEKEPLDSTSPLLELANIVITPHAAYYSEEAMVILRESVSNQVVEVLKDKRPPMYLVNIDVLNISNSS